MNKRKSIPVRGLRPLDSGAVSLLGQVTMIMVQSLIIFITGFFVSESGMDIEGNTALNFSLLAINQIILLGTVYFYSRLRGISFFGELDLKRGLSFSQVLMLILITFSTIMAFMPISSLFIMGLTEAGYTHSLAIPDYFSNVGMLILAIIFIAILPAIGEEVMFRGFVAKGYRRFGIIAAFLISSLLFATAHGNLLQLIYQFFLGLVLVTVYFATRSIYASIIVHALNNTTALVINYIMFKTTGDTNIALPWTGAKMVWIMLGISLLGMITLCLAMWLFLHITRLKQDKYVNGRDINIYATKVYGKHNKKGKNIITWYFDIIKYLNFSYEENERENNYRSAEEINYERADEGNRGYCKELLDARNEKNTRWDRNMMIATIAFNIFILIVNVIGAFKG